MNKKTPKISKQKQRTLMADLGIAISGATLRPGHRRTQEEIAAYAGITKQAVQLIERRAMKKLRRAMSSKGLTIDDFLHSQYELNK